MPQEAKRSQSLVRTLVRSQIPAWFRHSCLLSWLLASLFSCLFVVCLFGQTTLFSFRATNNTAYHEQTAQLRGKSLKRHGDPGIVGYLEILLSIKNQTIWELQKSEAVWDSQRLLKGRHSQTDRVKRWKDEKDGLWKLLEWADPQSTRTFSRVFGQLWLSLKACCFLLL